MKNIMYYKSISKLYSVIFYIAASYFLYGKPAESYTNPETCVQQEEKEGFRADTYHKLIETIEWLSDRFQEIEEIKTQLHPAIQALPPSPEQSEAAIAYDSLYTQMSPFEKKLSALQRAAHDFHTKWEKNQFSFIYLYENAQTLDELRTLQTDVLLSCQSLQPLSQKVLYAVVAHHENDPIVKEFSQNAQKKLIAMRKWLSTLLQETTSAITSFPDSAPSSDIINQQELLKVLKGKLLMLDNKVNNFYRELEKDPFPSTYIYTHIEGFNALRAAQQDVFEFCKSLYADPDSIQTRQRKAFPAKRLGKYK